MTDGTSKKTTDDDDLAATLAADPEEVEYMFAQTASGLDIDQDRVTLKGVSATTLFFSDRPERVDRAHPDGGAPRVLGRRRRQLRRQSADALLSIFEEDTVNDVVVVLREPVLSGADFSYSVEVTDGDLTPSSGPVSLFIDMIGRPLSPMSVAGVRRGRRRARRGMR